ncbi:Hypothetical_protein [Hexamita inflata]|uniref:Hypothetical_protein n=1 Tax=Hexamita inflata TaxID=28002 RepID=A0AA86TY53_9EUKA|nr:Hypothetical protein HINF_LOCUS19082 [Hexamita inflata]
MSVVLYETVNIKNVSIDQSVINQQCIQQTTAGGIMSYQTQCIIVLQQIQLTNSIMTSQSIESFALSAAIIGVTNLGNRRPNMQLSETQVNLQTIFVLNTTVSTSTLNHTKYIITAGICAYNFMSIDTIQNVVIQNSTLNANLRASGVFGVYSNSTATLSNIRIKLCVISTDGYSQSFTGGYIAETVLATVSMLSCSISNTKISGNIQQSGNVMSAGVIASIYRSKFTFVDVTTKNLLLISNGSDVYSGSLVGSFSTDVDQVKVRVESCSFQSTNIVFTSSVNSHVSNSIQLFSMTTALFDVTVVNSETFGFSYVNGVRIGNCPELKTQVAAGAYLESQTGC